ncbi:MAG TPA: pitrilysin family protein [bacterium]|nr:pitrilysin family protein [bacterium]
MSLFSHPLLPYREETLSCGANFISKEVSSVPIVAIDVWVSVGAAEEPEKYLGLSHFYEHMFFKGTKNLGVGEMDRAIKGLGGYNNAATAWDYTHYYVVVPSPGWQRAMEVLIDALRFPLFDPQEIESERQVIYEEIKRHEDTPWSKFYERFDEAAYARCPYSRNILGTFESLAGIDRDVFLEFLRTKYTPEHITVVTVGNIDRNEVRDRLEHFLDGLAPSDGNVTNGAFEMIDSPRTFDLHMPINQSYLLLGHPTPRIAGTRDEAVLDLASILLGEGRSSRLYTLLKEELGLVSSVSTSCWSQVRAGLFVTEAVTDEENLPEVEKRILDELNRLCSIPPGEKELERGKKIALANYAFSNETVSSISHTYGSSQILGDIEHVVRYPDMIQSITSEELSGTLSRYLRENLLCVGHLLPKEGEPVEDGEFDPMD